MNMYTVEALTKPRSILNVATGPPEEKQNISNYQPSLCLVCIKEPPLVSLHIPGVPDLSLSGDALEPNRSLSPDAPLYL